MPVTQELSLSAINADMVTSTAIAPSGSAAAILGKRVERASATLPASTATPYFTVSGGPILLTQIYGVVTTVVQAQACNAKLIANPTTGSDVDLCAVLNITGAAAGSFLTITGTVGDAMLNLVAVKVQALGLIVPVGSIDFSCSATNTGATRWVLHYVPLEADSAVVAA